MEPPKRLIERIFDFCVTIAVCAFLLRIAAHWIVEAAPYLLALAAIVLIATVGYRVWKHLRGMGKW